MAIEIPFTAALEWLDVYFAQLLGNLFSYDRAYSLMETITIKNPEHIEKYDRWTA